MGERIFIGMYRPTREQMQNLINNAAGSYMICCLDSPHGSTTVEGTWECWRSGHYDVPKYKIVEEDDDK